MTNHARYTLRLMIGIVIVGFYLASAFELSQRASGPHDKGFWISLVANILLLALMLGAPRFLPPKFPPISAGHNENRPSES